MVNNMVPIYRWICIALRTIQSCTCQVLVMSGVIRVITLAAILTV